MFRLLGFLIGTAISIAIILLVTGVPEFHIKDPEIDQRRFDEAVEKLMARKEDAELAVGQVADAIAVATESIPAPPPEVYELPQGYTGNNTGPLVTEQEEQTVQVLADDAVMTSNALPTLAADPQWYSFWNPFRSRIAASGFVARLEEITGLDYRVVKVKAGVYEVAFAYVDDDERRMKLAVISDATGLDLPDS